MRGVCEGVGGVRGIHRGFLPERGEGGRDVRGGGGLCEGLCERVGERVCE